jgi:ABC-type glycerol-3-phosphate transport system substrate-binding protein
MVGGAAAATAAGAVASGCSLVGANDPSSSSGDKVTIKVAIVPDPTGASEFYRQQFDTLEKRNPDIKVEIIENPTAQELTAVELAFQQGNAPDIFRIQDNLFEDVYAKGWVASLDKYVTAEFTSRFPAGSLNPATSGLHRDGKLYSLPLVWGPWSFTRTLLVNHTAAKVGGYTGVPATWEELESAATAITRAGGGKTFGFSGLWQAGGLVQMLQTTAGPFSVSSGVDYRTGKTALTDPSLVNAVELIRRMHNNKVMTPGWETWTDATQLYTPFAKDQLAIFIASPYEIAVIRTLNPDIDMSIAPVPVPASGRGGYSGQTSSFSPLWSMSAQSKNPDKAWKVMDFFASKEFQLAYYNKFATLTAVQSAWQDKAAANPDQKAIMDVAAASVRLSPNPILSSDGGKQLMTAIGSNQDLAWAEVALPAILHNQPFAPAATQLNAKLDAFINQEIKDLSAKGVKVSRADITFPDWNPLQAYQPGQK